MILAIAAVSIALVPASESDADDSMVTLEIPEVKAGAGAVNVEVPLKIVDVQGTGFSALSFDLEYEAEYLVLKEIKKGTLMPVFPEKDLSSPCTIVCEADDNVIGTGIILTFVFDVVDDAAGMNLPLHMENREAVNASGSAVGTYLEGTATIVVDPDITPVTSVTLDRTSLVLAVNEKYRLEATVLPLDATDRNVTWSSDNMSVANVDVLGYVTAVSVGTAKITVTTDDGGKTAMCDVTVQDKVIPIDSISFDVTSLDLEVGGHDTLIATVLPDNATDKTLRWASNDTSVATVDQEGHVEAVAPGIATVTASSADGFKSAFCVVTVRAIYVTGVTLDKTTLDMREGGSDKLVATLVPDNATDKSVSWTSSNTGVATVDQDGSVKAVAAGSATITVTTHDGGKTATCAVTVKQAVRVTGVELGRSDLALLIGGSEKLNATVLPDNADDKSVTWKSSDENIAAVDSEGNVKGVGVGTAKITVTTEDGGKTAECVVTVNPVVVTGVTLDRTEVTVEEGKVVKLVATVLPDSATDKTVSWSTSNPDVATVDHNGIVKGVAAGTATITVTTTDGGKTATCAVTVTEHQVVHVDSVTLDKTKADVNVGKTVRIVPTVAPDNADDKSVTWKSSDEKIATVDKDGNVKGVAVGSATITATTVDGGYSASCAVTVSEAPADNTLLYVGIIAAIVIVLLIAFFVMRSRSGRI